MYLLWGFSIIFLVFIYIMVISFLYNESLNSCIFIINPKLPFYILFNPPERKIKRKESFIGYRKDFLLFHLSFSLHMLLSILSLGIYALFFLTYFQMAKVYYCQNLIRINNLNETTMEIDFVSSIY